MLVDVFVDLDGLPSKAALKTGPVAQDIVTPGYRVPRFGLTSAVRAA